MVKTVGPAVGSKGQIGFKEESKWGYAALPPNKFLDFTSESIVSTYTSLESNALRADRGRHKQRIGTESAGGDINFEFAPEGFGTLLKHSLGQRLTKRKDVAFVMIYGGTDTNINITLSSSALTVTTSGLDGFTKTIANGDTVQSLITYIDGTNATNWTCFAPWGDGSDTTAGGYFARSLANKGAASSTLGASDWDSSALAKTVAGVFNLETFSDVHCGVDTGANSYIFFPINFKYGVYEHTIDAYSDLPQGITVEMGRDVAAFNYYGLKINTLAFTFNPGEIITGTAGIMCKGASTCGDPSANTLNTGWSIPVVNLRYAGSAASAKLQINNDSTQQFFLFEAGAVGTEEIIWDFSLERGYYDFDGHYWEVTTIGGLLEFLEYESDYFSVTRKGGISSTDLSTTIITEALVALASDSDTSVMQTTLATAVPLIRGNYIGTDAGESVTVTVEVSTGGSTDGTAAFYAKKTGDAGYSSATTITYNTWYNILDYNGVDTGFDIMFPDNVTLVLGDKWTFTSFKDENSSTSYETEDVLTGFQGAILFDKGDGAGAVSQAVMGANFTLTNNLYGDKFELGERQRAALVPQKRTTDGTLTLEFDDLDIYRMFTNGVAGSLTITVTSDEYVASSTTKYTAQFKFPNIKFSGTTPNVGGPDIIQTDFPFTSLYDDTNSIPDLRIVLTNSQSYI